MTSIIPPHLRDGMNGYINSVHGGGIVHTIRVEECVIQTWFFDDWGMNHTANGKFLSDLP